MPFETIAFIPAALFALGAIITRRGLEESTPGTANLITVLTSATGFVILSLFLLDFSEIRIAWYWAAFLAAGLVSPSLSLILVFRSFRNIGVASTMALGNTYSIFGALWAVSLIGERPSPWVWGGIALVALGAWTISSRGGGLRHRPRHLALPLFAAACFGLSQALRKVGLLGGGSIIFGGLLQTVTAALAVPLFLLMIRDEKTYLFTPPSVRIFLLGGLTNFLAQIFLLLALSGGEVSRVSPIVSTVPLFTLLFTPVFLGEMEKLNPRIVWGAISIVTGTVLVTAIR